MKKTGFTILVFFVISIVLNVSSIIAQDNIDWLTDYTSEINAGSYFYKYSFTAVDNNTCKIKIEEVKTDNKGKTSSGSYILYISDIDPSLLSFKASGKIIEVNMETRFSHKFITVFGGAEFEGYTNKITVYMSEVDKARSFIEAVKSHIGTCQQTDRAWTSREETFAWLINNIGESGSSGTTYKQAFSKGERSYMAQLKTEKADSKGNKQTATRVFDLSDINPSSISVSVAGRELTVELPVRDNKYFVQVMSDDGSITYSKSVEIHADDIELARNIANALTFLVSDTKPDRKGWTSYSQALTFVKENLKEVKAGSSTYAQSLSFGASPSDIVHFRSVVTDSKGMSAEEVSSVYLNDLLSSIELNVSSSNAYLGLETKDKNKFIKQTSEGRINAYSGSLKVYVDDIDNARDVINALEHAIKNSNSGIMEFVSMEKTMEWLLISPGEVTIDLKNIKQTLRIAPALENKMELLVITTDEGSPPVNERFEIYPEDLSVEDIEITISGKKLYVPLSTGKLKYVKAFKENEIQNFGSSADVLFGDVLEAKNFIAAVKFIHEKSLAKDRLAKDKVTAWSYIDKYLRKIETGGIGYDQKIEKQGDDDCKLKFVRVETDSKGTSTEYVYELILSDIDPANSGITVSAGRLNVNLITNGKQKLIKTYKNGEVGNFVYDFDLFTDDVLVAKSILGAFTALSNECK